MMDTTASGHTFFGLVHSAQEAHAVLEASKQGILPRVTRRLTDEERVRFVQAGAVFVWEEEEAGIRRWTDHIKWSPSRVSGAFLTYTEMPSRNEDSLIKQSFSATDARGTKMHLIAYASKAALATPNFPTAARDPLLRKIMLQRSSPYPREVPTSRPSTAMSTSSVFSPITPVSHPHPYKPSLPAYAPFTRSSSVTLPTYTPQAKDWLSSSVASTSTPPPQYYAASSSSSLSSSPPTRVKLPPFRPPGSGADDPLERVLPSIRIEDAPESVRLASLLPAVVAPLRGTFLDEEEDDEMECIESYRAPEDHRQLSLFNALI